MNFICRVITGSRLYGTFHDTSDTDIRGVYLPPLADIVLGRHVEAQEDKKDGDKAYYSLQKFCSLANEGQSVAIEMLHSPFIITHNVFWSKLVTNRSKFYTKSMQSFIGFAKTMSAKYSSRADRLQETEAVLRILCDASSSQRLGDMFDFLPESTNVRKGTSDSVAGPDKRIYTVCGRELHARLPLPNARAIIQNISDAFGERVREIKDGNIEWKSLSHAFRAALQCQEIIQTGDLKFPLKDAPWLRAMRLGQLNFTSESLDKKLDDLIVSVQQQLDASSLPEKAERAFTDNLILEAYNLS